MSIRSSNETYAEQYGYDDFNNCGVLKLSGWMWLWIAFMLRHSLLWLGLSISHSLEALPDFSDESHWRYLLCGVPAMLILVTSGFRVPDAGRYPRWIWRQGRWLLASGIICHLLMAATAAWFSKVEWQVSIIPLLSLFLDVWILWLVFRSPRVKDVFDDFPLPKQ